MRLPIGITYCLRMKLPLFIIIFCPDLFFSVYLHILIYQTIDFIYLYSIFIKQFLPVIAKGGF